MCATMAFMRVFEARFEGGLLRPSRPLALRPGGRVHLIVVREPDPQRWDIARLAQSHSADEAVLTEQGLEDWAASLDPQVGPANENPGFNRRRNC
jgi:predicted DNA-binding antitoxin AbrB/MazE fold protein